MGKKVQFVLILLAFLFVNCDRPECTNTNPIFNKYTPESEEYKTELVKQLDRIDPSKLTYWFQKYSTNSGNEQLYFNIQGNGLCAIIVLDVEDWSKLKELKEKKGVSFQGAEFKNLTFDIIQDSSQTKFIYRNFDRIID